MVGSALQSPKNSFYPKPLITKSDAISIMFFVKQEIDLSGLSQEEIDALLNLIKSMKRN